MRTKFKSQLSWLLGCLILLLFVQAASAFPTWIGVTGGLQRQTGGNPGTFTVLMNQYYATLHASVGISVNGAGWKEYPMNYDGRSGPNQKWSLTPAALFPNGATVRYYFRGWDDAGGVISDGTMTLSYSFVSTPLPVVAVPGDVDVYGSTFSMGSWLDDFNHASLALSAIDSGASSNSFIRFIATRPANDWSWERTTALNISEPMMKLDSLNRLSLFSSAGGANGTIVLDPGGNRGNILLNGEQVLTSGAAAVSYLPLTPARLAIGAGNTAATNSLAAGNLTQATGQNSFAAGIGSSASGEDSAAFGDHTQAQGLGQFVVGSYNIPQGNPLTAGPTDAIFTIGNGTDASHRANALTLLRNGNLGIGIPVPSVPLEVQGDAKIHGALRVNGPIRVAPQGDLSMGEFTQGTAP